MDDASFGKLALDLLNGANIQGAMLDVALEFRQHAREMIAGQRVSEIVPATESETKKPN